MNKTQAKIYRVGVKSTTTKQIESVTTLKFGRDDKLTPSSQCLVNLYLKLFALNCGNSCNANKKVDTPSYIGERVDGKNELIYIPSNFWDVKQLAIIAEVVNTIRDDVTIGYIDNGSENFFYCFDRKEISPLQLFSREKIKTDKVVKIAALDGSTQEIHTEIEEYQLVKITAINTADIMTIYNKFVEEKSKKSA